MLTVCRLCLAKEANFVTFNRQVAIRIMSCTGLDVESNDGLPQLICQDCRLRLEEFHYFRKRCQAADRRLRCAKRLERDGNAMESNALFEGDEEDALHLQDVALCTATACSESNARWRAEAAKMIRTEIDAYKKELLGMCKQQVREEIEQQVRTEVGELLLAQARKECRLNVLDSLFYELESFFVRKRNAIVCEQAYGSEGFISDSENADLESVSTILCEGNPSANDKDVEEAVLMFSDGEPVAAEPVSPTRPVVVTKEEPVTPQGPIEPVAMVEINMQNIQLSHLQEQPMTSNIVAKRALASVSKLSSPHSKSKLSFKSPAKTPIGKHKHTCRKHNVRPSRRRSSYLPTDESECYRCRLRSPPHLNKFP